ncbi:MAG: hypothetical protein OEW68_03865 [Gammaproteobacteria bacterium]|nr:hypothetical protein [Gammaproteobacteria bacterium]MDH4313957.1 hypothetical protein [Gammaproteobacteria bacterium]MDH5212690.1 hypothetical protein [Gammaproteobacteria bacterium]
MVILAFFAGIRANTNGGLIENEAQYRHAISGTMACDHPNRDWPVVYQSHLDKVGSVRRDFAGTDGNAAMD